MKILVTGGARFIGSKFLYYIVNKYPKYDEKFNFVVNIAEKSHVYNSIKN